MKQCTDILFILLSSFVNISFEKKSEKEIETTSSLILNNNDNNDNLNPFCNDEFKYDDIDEFEQEIIIKKEENKDNELKDIHLEYFKHRQHFLDDNDENLYHPNKLLDLYNNDKYYSDKVCNFKQNENDWIIFKLLYNDQYFIPKQFHVKNHSNEYAVKNLNIFIGNDDNKNEWFKLNKNEIILSNQNIFLQKFNIDLESNIDDNFILNKKLNCFKIEFINNFGANINDRSKFCIHYLGFKGKLIPSTDTINVD